MDYFDDLLAAIALGDAQKKAIAAENPYKDLSGGVGSINQAILGAAANPDYSTTEKIVAGLLGGIAGGGVDYLSNDWQGRAENEYRNAVTAGARNKTFERDLLPRSVFDSGLTEGRKYQLRSVFDQRQKQGEFENDLQKIQFEKGIDLALERDKIFTEKPWLRELEPVASRDNSAREGVSQMATNAYGPESPRDVVFRGLREGRYESPSQGFADLAKQSQRAEDLAREAEKLEYERTQNVFGSEDALRKEIATVPSVSQFITMQKSLPMVASFKDQNTKSSDIGFITNFVKSVDEGVVRGEDVRLAESANPLVQSYYKQLKGALDGTSQLGPELKNQMYEELLGSQAAVYDQAKADAEVLAKIGKDRGLGENIYPFDRTLEFSTEPTQSIEQTLAAGYQSGGMTGALQALASQYPNTPEGRELFKQAVPKVKSLFEGR